MEKLLLQPKKLTTNICSSLFHVSRITSKFKLQKTLLLCLLVCASAIFTAFGQGSLCSGGRYSADVFSNAIQTNNILYGANLVKDYSQGTEYPQQLYLDFYQPDGDTETLRPLIIFAFGGAFINGQRQDMSDICRAFALKGYATATIDYRLIPPGANGGSNYALVFGSTALIADQLVRASSDMKAAIRFFRHDAANTKTYRIDPNRIFVAGYSAGAIMALQTGYINSETEDPNFTFAYQNNGGIEGNTDLPSPNNLIGSYNANNISGVLSLAGALPDPNVLKVNDPPLYAAHGDNDEVIPYNSGPTFNNPAFTLYGGSALYTRANTIGLPVQLYTIAGGNHASSRQDPNRDVINNAAANFFQQIICPGTLPVNLNGLTASLNTSGLLRAKWKTVTEKDNNYFILQMSEDGKNWKELLRKDAVKGATQGASYEVETYIGTIGLAGFGLLSILLLPMTHRRYRWLALFAVLAMVTISCAKQTGLDKLGLQNGSIAAGKTIYIRLAQVDLDGTTTYHTPITVTAK